jgi:predicted DCC family thiol-disulfide oxidoreductase YuxK
VTSRQPAILLFDGDCGFCTSTANLVVRRSTLPVTAVPWQWADTLDYGLTPAQTAERVWLIIGNEKFSGHLAFAHLLFNQRNPIVRAVGWALTVPPFCWLGSIGYALIARFRHLLPGGTPACKMPPAR